MVAFRVGVVGDSVERSRTASPFGDASRTRREPVDAQEPGAVLLADRRGGLAPASVREWEMVIHAPASILAGLFFVALTLRPQIVGIGPLLPDDPGRAWIRRMRSSGLLANDPRPVHGALRAAGRISRRHGSARAPRSPGRSLLIGVFGLARAVAPSAALLVLFTWPVGVGMGLAGALVPVAVKERFPVRPAGPTGVYTTGIQVGSARVGRHSGTARRVVRRLACVARRLLARHLGARGRAGSCSRDTIRRTSAPASARRACPGGAGVAWLLVALFALMASTYYGINAWLPDSYVERGWSTQRPGTCSRCSTSSRSRRRSLIPWLSDRVGGRGALARRAWRRRSSSAMTGVVLVPAAAYAWVVALGIASGGMFALVLTLPLDLEHDARRVGALVGMMLGLGYTIGAFSPFVLGAVRDVTGSFTASLWLLVGFSVLLLGSVAALPRSHSRVAGYRLEPAASCRTGDRLAA